MMNFHSKFQFVFAFLCLAACSFESRATDFQKGRTSKLWGAKGETWDRIRIPDFSRAGYRQGNSGLPRYSAKINIKTLGAVGDGIADDTSIISAALRKCSSGKTLFFPPGAYKISQRLFVRGHSCAIVGAGETMTTLLFTKGLEELEPLYSNGQTRWSWSGALITFENTTESGTENLTIRFPDNTWDGHNFHERGYNAVGFDKSTKNCWLKNLTMTGPDLGIWIAQTASHISADHWVVNFGSNRGGQEISCHHAVNVYGGYNLLSNFRIEGVCQHDLSVESGKSIYNVFSNGKGSNLSFDHHSQDYEQKHNLFIEIDIGIGTRIYESGGQNTPRGVSFYEVWWNIKSVSPVPWVTSRGLSKGNVIVGVNTKEVSVLGDEYGNWFEAISPEAISPRNLYLSQREFLRKSK